MAKNANSDIFSAIRDDWQMIASKAINDAAKGIQKDILKEAKSCLQRYYDWKPDVYQRTDYLHNAMVPIFRNKSNSQHFLIEVGVGYDPKKLKNHYQSNSRFHQYGKVWREADAGLGAGHGKPEPEWILNNYLDGIHPWAWRDVPTTDSLMTNFINNEIEARIDKYMNTATTNIVMNRLKKMVVK